MVAAKTRKKREKPSQTVAAVPVNRPEPRLESIPTACIDRSPWQPREAFPADEIAALAQSLRENGQLVPIRVRPIDGGRYELIAGERRLRATIGGGQTMIRAEVVEATDAEVRQMILVEGLQRKDFNVIEEAKAFRNAIDAGDAAGPTELAKQLGMSQGHVSNRLRLLELPAKWQKRVISQEIPATHARSIVRYAKHPTILEEIDKDIENRMRWDGGLGTADEFDEMVNDSAVGVAKPVAGKRHSKKLGREVTIFTPTDEQREQLGIVEIPYTDGKNAEPYATNVELWEKLQEEHETRLAAKADKKDAGKDRKNAKPLTAAEQKRLKEEEARKAKERDEKFSRRLREWKEDWMRYVIAEHLRHCADINQIARVLMLGLSEWPCNCAGFDVDEAMGFGHRREVVRNLFSVQDFELDKAAGKLAAQMFYDGEGGPMKIGDGRDLESLCEFGLEIDLGVEWNNHQAGPLSEAYWRLHTKEQLVALAGELKADFADDVLRGTKDQLVAAFVARIPAEDDKEAGLPLPKEIIKAKGE